jgi:hypothetical protein
VSYCEDLLARYLDTLRGGFNCTAIAENQIIIATPYSFADGDRLELSVTFYDDRVVISDLAIVSGRLDLVEVNADTKRVFDQINSIAKGYDIEVFNDELRVHGPVSMAGDMILRLIGAMHGVDALQALRSEPRGPQFARRLVTWLGQHGRDVVPRAKVIGRSGSLYRVTAAVEAELPVYVQAVTPGAAESDTRSVDRTFRVFSDVNGHLETRQKLAVLGQSERGFTSGDVRLLQEVCYVGAWWDLQRISHFLLGELGSERRLFEDVAQGQFDEGEGLGSA